MLVCWLVAVSITAQIQLAAAAAPAAPAAVLPAAAELLSEPARKLHVRRRALFRSNLTWVPGQKNQLVDPWKPRDIVEGPLLGQGAFGKASLAYLPGAVRLSDGQRQPLVFVVKRITLANEQQRRDFVCETNLLKLFTSPHILGLFGYFIEPTHQRIQRGTVYGNLITEYVTHGDLVQATYEEQQKWCAENEYGMLTERQAMRYLVQVLFGLREMHERASGAIAHNDLKQNNIFLTDNNVVKIGDLGLSCRVDEPNPNPNIFQAGDNAAPEVIYRIWEKLPPKEKLKRDTWALGLLLHAMIAPSSPDSAAEISRTWMSQEAADLIALTLTKNPFERPSVAELLGHPTVRQHYEQLLISDLRNRQTPEIECHPYKN